MLVARDVTVHRGGRLVLDAVSLTVGPGQRVGVVGPNGIGKSTFLRVLAGIDAPDGGRVELAPATLTVGYLPQEPDAAVDELLLEYLARRTGVAAASQELDRRTEQLAADPDALDAYTEALERFLALGGDDLDVRAAVVCADLGLPADRLTVPVGALSGGQAARAALAVILLARFDVLLLDEPTNDLDFAGLERLERFVRETPSAVVAVSHDRAFLDGTVDRILEIEEHSHRAVEYAGGWTDYVAARELARGQQTEAYEKFQAERRTLATRARTQRSWSEQGVRAVKRSGEPDKNIRRKKTERSEKQAAKAKITERAMERLEARAVDKPWEGWQLDLVFDAGERSGAVVARLDQAVVHRGSFTLGPLDLEVEWQDRVAIVGPNGSGKTTLLRAVLGEQPLDAGTRWVGPGVRFGTLDQARQVLATDDSLLDAFCTRTGLLVTEARSQLAKLGLDADAVARPPAVLSPGERSRAILAALAAGGVELPRARRAHQPPRPARDRAARGRARPLHRHAPARHPRPPAARARRAHPHPRAAEPLRRRDWWMIHQSRRQSVSEP